MKLNHVNLTVFDALETRLFLEKYFGLRGQEGGNRGFQVVYDDNNLVLTLIKGRAEDVKYPPTFHIGFIQPSEQHVDAINAAAQGRRVRRAAAKPAARVVDVLLPGARRVRHRSAGLRRACYRARWANRSSTRW